jgi:hypothetical protein
MVVKSIQDDPIRLRPLRYLRREPEPAKAAPRPVADRIPLVVNDKHEIHHVKDRGYVEAPVRISAILRELEQAVPFERLPPRTFSEDHIRAVHAGAFVDYLRRACALVPAGKSIYPYVFPIRNTKRPPKELPLRAGYFCIDTFTPLNANAWLAARRAVDCTLTAAERVLSGARFAYSRVRPPGHHAERRPSAASASSTTSPSRPATSRRCTAFAACSSSTSIITTVTERRTSSGRAATS